MAHIVLPTSLAFSSTLLRGEPAGVNLKKPLIVLQMQEIMTTIRELSATYDNLLAQWETMQSQAKKSTRQANALSKKLQLLERKILSSAIPVQVQTLKSKLSILNQELMSKV